MQLPPVPGVYVVELLNEEPISVNADRPVIAERCIKVTRANCKYGKAANLARRQREYHKTFGAQNVRFRFFSTTEQHALVEALVGQRLAAFRIPGVTGRLNEWLQGIAAHEVEAVVKSILATLPTSAPTLGSGPTSNRVARPVSQDPVGVSPTRLVEAARYLERQAMSVSLLRDLHHSPRRDETFAATLRYFSKKTELRLNNQLYGARLIFVAAEHRATGLPFEQLVQAALRRHPR
ncbi:GIY-YIG nuclease family protein [Paucibacter sp. TC2R-5]|uniref:GIY-YIG nuclease family protein n=1 Tax=Paucibacter sp. TC2R-5 TaxID=2893555 RepID=UPI0021E4E518|nr:GIY-YIG nuclease family protein [Paucibacter sp. TC2R-5]MCV2357629.1 GIY-YIG nuclease family protein [Paucibacter sp. TC2R-5]